MLTGMNEAPLKRIGFVSIWKEIHSLLIKQSRILYTTSCRVTLCGYFMKRLLRRYSFTQKHRKREKVVKGFMFDETEQHSLWSDVGEEGVLGVVDRCVDPPILGSHN